MFPFSEEETELWSVRSLLEETQAHVGSLGQPENKVWARDFSVMLSAVEWSHHSRAGLLSTGFAIHKSAGFIVQSHGPGK